MPRPEHDDPEDKRLKKFPIQRKHLGRINSLPPDKDFGFIEAESFRDDVFFHFTVYDGKVVTGERTQNVKLEEDLWVEFELDEDVFRKDNKLRAKTVCPSNRPRGRKLSGRDATFNIMTRHPKARKKRPTWRNKDT